MVIDLTYNGQTNREKGLYLKKFPSFSYSNEKYNSTVINGRRGALITNLNSYDNIKVTVSFLINGDYMKKIREIKQWLSGKGRLSFSDDGDIYYEVQKITYGNENRTYYDRGTFEVVFSCFPFEFSKDGATAFEWSAGYITNNYDYSFPVYEIAGGTGFITVDGQTFSFSNINETFIIDTRRSMVYGKESGKSLLNKTSGDLSCLNFKKGRQSLTCTPQAKITPNWGYCL